jgi:hypothetical protein
MTEIEQARQMLLEDPSMIPSAMKECGNANSLSPELGIAAYQILYVWNARRSDVKFPTLYKRVGASVISFLRNKKKHGLEGFLLISEYVKVFGTALPESVLSEIGKDRNSLSQHIYTDRPGLRGAVYSASMSEEDADWGNKATAAWISGEDFDEVPPSHGKPAYVGNNSRVNKLEVKKSSVSKISENSYDRAFTKSGRDLNRQRRNMFLFLAGHESNYMGLRQEQYAAAYPIVHEIVKQGIQQFPEYVKNSPASFSPPSLRKYIPSFKEHSTVGLNGWAPTFRQILSDKDFTEFLHGCIWGSHKSAPKSPVAIAPANIAPADIAVEKTTPQVKSISSSSNPDTGVSVLLNAIFASKIEAKIELDYPRVTVKGVNLPMGMFFRPGIFAEVSTKDGIQSVTITQKE